MSKNPITITHSASGATFTINPFGAHITSWTHADGRALIFLSRDAIMDGTKPIRGEKTLDKS
jgi:D-hexose-6-phosphate mutarotase